MPPSPTFARKLAKFNKHVTNRIQGKWAGTLPLYGIVLHRGRKSGNKYQTPVVLLPAKSGYAVMAAYGRNSAWILNIEAAGYVDLRHRRKSVHLDSVKVLSREESLDNLTPTARRVVSMLKPEWIVYMSTTN